MKKLFDIILNILNKSDNQSETSESDLRNNPFIDGTIADQR